MGRTLWITAGTFHEHPSRRSRPAFSDANPHALAIILEAAETRRIIATPTSSASGHQSVGARPASVSRTAAKLMDRQNRLESCLKVGDGVSAKTFN